MNYFAHAQPFLDDVYFAAGTGVPDWLTVADRQVRLRAKHVRPFLEDTDPVTAAVAGGIWQHIRDDAHFHQSRAFAELGLQLTVRVRDALGKEAGFRPSFLGHLLAEVLLDASLIAENPAGLKAYYAVLNSLDAGEIQRAVNRMAPRPTDRLMPMICGFCREQILWDYLEDAKLLVRLNQVMRRMELAVLGDHFRDLLGEARQWVEERKHDLLKGIPTEEP